MTLRAVCSHSCGTADITNQTPTPANWVLQRHSAMLLPISKIIPWSSICPSVDSGLAVFMAFMAALGRVTRWLRMRETSPVKWLGRYCFVVLFANHLSRCKMGDQLHRHVSTCLINRQLYLRVQITHLIYIYPFGDLQSVCYLFGTFFFRVWIVRLPC